MKQKIFLCGVTKKKKKKRLLKKGFHKKMPLSPRITNFEEKENASVLALTVNIMLVT